MRCALLVEEHAAFRQAMAYLLSRDLRVELVEEAATVAEARLKRQIDRALRDESSYPFEHVVNPGSPNAA